ncbi:MAG: adenylate/guanylate cyclase domain-containing protein, partial [Bacteroidota bacterium]|nr:adenylate/guanylate cyclase domain-containing protein [Bacteroidota bacterium]
MRRLSAIMFTDMVGYSALAQRNEALALELLDEHKELMRPFFGKHGGREIGTAGDSFFVEFTSAVEATECAIEIQNALYERNKTEPKERQILIRIGLHIGDVVYTDDNVHGDGVNIAARMEPLAKPGGICLSEDVARQIRNKIPYLVMKLGKGKLKNISLPVDIYSIVLPWQETHKKTKKGFPWKKLIPYALSFLSIIILVGIFFFIRNKEERGITHSKFRLAVLPLANIS